MPSPTPSPAFKKLFEDPTVVLVVTASADKQGSNEQIYESRKSEPRISTCAGQSSGYA